MNRTEQDLIKRCNQGDAAAMEELYRTQRDWVFAVALKFCANSEDAQDVLQEVFKYFFNKFPGFALTCSLRTFLYPVVKNKSIDLIRKRKPTIEFDETWQSPEDATPRDEESSRSTISDIVGGLSEEHRDVVVHRFADGLSLNEISANLNVPLGTVKSRLHNALNLLKKKLKKE